MVIQLGCSKNDLVILAWMFHLMTFNDTWFCFHHVQGVSGSIVLRHGRLSDLIAQLQDLLNGAQGVESTPFKYDGALLAAQIRQLANEIKELTMTNPVTIFNGDSNSSGYASYLVPAAAVGAMGYCYMWWKGWSFSDAMFVTKKNMADAVASVSKQLDDLSDTLAVNK
jgi:hypothetical protein